MTATDPTVATQITAAPIARKNPYIGPQAFMPGQKLYGRNRELKALLGLLIAERIVLLYSPSGAGKTSLVQAGLVPELQSNGFHVLPVIRVSHDSSADMPPNIPDANRYVLSTVMSLEATPGEQSGVRPWPWDQPTEQTAPIDLSSYLDTRREHRLKSAEGGADLREEVLIFDQFEEVLTVDPFNVDAKKAFFDQVGRALRDRSRWALFVIREDFLAALDPYKRIIPTELSTTFRLDLLGEAAARLAVQRPAQDEGVTFADAAAEKLVDDLRRVKAPQTDASGNLFVLGPYVEPVELQVVCRSLWQNLAPDDTEITEEDMDAVGDVDQALGDYYAVQVGKIAGQTNVPERVVRDWFEQQLITPQGIRGQVLREPEKSHGLDNRAITALVDTHLVRAEQRRGATWYELSHDRLIQPVLNNNREWREHHLSILQRQAAVWETAGKVPALLVSGAPLREAEHWAAEHQGELLPVDQEFLQASQQVEHTSTLLRTRTRVIVALVGVIALVLAGSLVYFVQQSNRLEAYSQELLTNSEKLDEQRQVLHARQLAGLGANQSADHADLGLLLGLEADRALPDTARLSDTADEAEVHNSLLFSLASSSNLAGFLKGHDNAVTGITFSTDGKLAASTGWDMTIRLWDAPTHKMYGEPLEGYDYLVQAMAFSQDGNSLIAASEEHVVEWQVRDKDGAIQPPVLATYAITYTQDSGQQTQQGEAAAEPAIHLGYTAQRLAISPGGTLVALSGCQDDCSGGVAIRLWDTARHEFADGGEPLIAPQTAVNILAFSRDGNMLASGGGDGTIALWDISDRARPQQLGPPIQVHNQAVSALVFSPDGKILASGSTDTSVVLSDVTGPEHKRIGLPILQHTDSVFALAFSHDGKMLASGSSDTKVVLWDLTDPANPARINQPLAGYAESVDSLAFAPDDRTLLAGYIHGNIAVWNTESAPAIGERLAGYSGGAQSLTFSPDGTMLASAGMGRTIFLWDTEKYLPLDSVLSLPEEPGAIPWQAQDAISNIAFSPDGKLLAAGTCGKLEGGSSCSQGQTVLWNMADKTSPALIDQQLISDGGPVTTVSIGPDSRTLVAGAIGTVGSVTLWDIQGVTARKPPIPTHISVDDPVSVTAASPNGEKFSVGGYVGDPSSYWYPFVTVYTVTETTVETKTLEDYEGDMPVSLDFNPDGTILAVGDARGGITLWNTTTYLRVNYSNMTHNGRVQALAFSADGRMLATGSSDRTIRLWDVSDPANPVAIGPPLVGHYSQVLSLAFNPRDGKLASGDSFGIILWDVNFDNWKTLACRKAGRPLSDAEASQYGVQLGFENTCSDQVAAPGSQGSGGNQDSRLNDSVQLAVNTDDPIINNDICWQGSIDGFALAVLPTCERALTLTEPYGNDKWFRDTRGLALTLAGKDLQAKGEYTRAQSNYLQASKDFQSFVDWILANQDLAAGFNYIIPTRREWIKQLTSCEQNPNCENPIDRSALDRLRNGLP